MFVEQANVNLYAATLECFSTFVRVVSEFAPPPEVKLKPSVLQRSDRTKPNIKDAGRGRGRGQGCIESKVDDTQFVQMKSVFSEGPMMAQAQAHVNNSRLYCGKFWNICRIIFAVLNIFYCALGKTYITCCERYSLCISNSLLNSV